MAGKLCMIFSALGVAVIVGTEVVRSVVHRRRERIHGPGGGTQDILLWGMFFTMAWFIAAGVCGLLWIFDHGDPARIESPSHSKSIQNRATF
jgi:hypothetical protein